MRDVPQGSNERGRFDRLCLVLASLLVLGFVIAFSSRPTILLSTAGADDALFIRLGEALASGRWLGRYNELTLAKGPGFPAFLALVNLSSLPYMLAVSLAYAASAAYAARVASAFTRSSAVGVVLIAALLFLPVLYNGELLRVFREIFYASATLAFVASAISLATGCLGRRWPTAVVTGVLGAWVWLTREEGVWLVPAAAILALTPLTMGQTSAQARRALAPAGVALAISVALVTSFGLVNWAVYGRFVVNEVKDSAFQGALSALQDAAWPYHREGVPVPAAARARLYAVSPTFASLREPLLDGPLQADATRWGCQEDRKFCGDFGGGWFLWALRSSAALHGEHASPTRAAAFYRRLAEEIRGACADGRLACGHWVVPLVPAMKADELPAVARSLAKMGRVLTFGEPVARSPRRSDLSAADAEEQRAFLNHPQLTAGAGAETVTFQGWFVRAGGQWLAVEAAAPAKLVSFSRESSPDLVTYFHDTGLQRQRYTLVAECPIEAECPMQLTFEGGGAARLDLNRLTIGDHRLAGGRLFLDRRSSAEDAQLLKTRFARRWVSTAVGMRVPFAILAYAGLAGWILMVAVALIRRRSSAPLLISTALLAAIAARALLLALIDALSFPAVNATYALPAFPLLAVFSVISLHGAFVALDLLEARRGGSAPAEVTEIRPAARAAESAKDC